jgi:hypothetical protein
MDMNNQQEILSSQLEQIHVETMWLATIPRLLELIAFILVLVAIIYIFNKTKAPGSLLMLIGLVLSVLLALLTMFLVNEAGTSNLSQSRIIWIIQLASSFFIFLAGYGFLKFALSVKNGNKS